MCILIRKSNLGKGLDLLQTRAQMPLKGKKEYKILALIQDPDPITRINQGKKAR